ncbi:MAG: hypothetical protein UZ19_OD1000031 [Parcubacteria bacterium OLB19]|nr:MAG: hypothetical protein UZ19_OD1000031 [Parcubacteria bacterium OLB19]
MQIRLVTLTCLLLLTTLKTKVYQTINNYIPHQYKLPYLPPNPTPIPRMLCIGVVHFADPGKPHQRGTNENTNGLLRQYFPKGSAFANIKNSDVTRAVNQLNNRPRKRLNYLTPREYLEREGVRFR